MRVLISVTYYEPHVSGLTIYVRRLARALVQNGHEVTVLTSRFDARLPREETCDGVRIVRVPVARRVSKGVLMPSLGRWASRLAKQHDVVSIHLPQFDAPGIAARSRLAGKPVVLTYHCDLQLPPGPFNRVVDKVVYGANSTAARLANRIVAYTQDYADHSPLLRQFSRKLEVIPPPVEMPPPDQRDVDAFKAEHCEGYGPIIGIAARFASEKGIEHLIGAIPALLPEFPGLKVLFAGPHEDVIGEDEYRAKLAPRLAELGDRWEFLGTLPPDRINSFYQSLDCLVVASVNSTESFGLVQVEAMLCGTPVVVTNLPGVRQPVQVTGMGKVVGVGDAKALANGIREVVTNREKLVRPRAEIEAIYDLPATARAYEELFSTLIAEAAKPAGEETGGAQHADYLRRQLREMPPHRALLRSVEAKWMGSQELVHPVLDVGCGDGHFASATYREALDVGLDPSSRALAEAQARGRQVYRDLVLGSAAAMPFPGASFNTVVSNSSIEHIPDLGAALAEIARVLTPGGPFYTTVPSVNYPRHLLGSTMARTVGWGRGSQAYGAFFNRISRHYHVYDHLRWAELCGDAGLELVEHFYYFSPAAHRAFDIAHYIGVPNLVTKKLLGRWVLHPGQGAVLRPWYRRYYEEGPREDGAYLFLHLRRKQT